jgi:uncharacterized membrane protein
LATQTQRKARPVGRNAVKVAPAPQQKPQMIYWIVAGVSILGLVDAGYLFVEYLLGNTDVCTPGILLNCNDVLSSAYAKIGGFPLSGIGAVTYFVVFSLAVLAVYGYKSASKWLAIIVAMMFAMSIYLFYIQASVLGHYCPFCLFSAGVTVVLTGLVWIPRLRKKLS